MDPASRTRHSQLLCAGLRAPGLARKWSSLAPPAGRRASRASLAVCKPGGLAAAAYSPSSGTWRSINPPEWSRSADRLDVTVVGAVAGQVVLSTNAPDPKHRLVLLDPASETWSDVPTLPSADAICVAGGELVGVRTGAVDASGETGTASATSLSHPLETFSLDPLNGSGQWKELSSLKKNASLDTLLEHVYCSDDQLIYVPIWRPPVGIDVGALSYEGGGKWSALPSFKSAGFSGAPSPALSGPHGSCGSITAEAFIFSVRTPRNGLVLIPLCPVRSP